MAEIQNYDRFLHEVPIIEQTAAIPIFYSISNADWLFCIWQGFLKMQIMKNKTILTKIVNSLSQTISVDKLVGNY